MSCVYKRLYSINKDAGRGPGIWRCRRYAKGHDSGPSRPAREPHLARNHLQGASEGGSDGAGERGTRRDDRREGNTGRMEKREKKEDRKRQR